MTKDKRNLSSPENGKLSNGPKTEQGKQRSSANATTHGAYSQRLLVPGERQEDLDHLIQAHYNQWRPKTAVEQHLVREMALVMWRRERISRSETALLDIQMQRMQPGLDAEFEGLTSEALYALAHHALLSHNGAAAQLARQERRLLRQYAQLRTELEALRQQPPVEQPANHPVTPADLHPDPPIELAETNLTRPLAAATKVVNADSIIYQYLPAAPKPPASGTPQHLKAAS